MPRALRIISWAPTSYSRSRIWRLSEGWAVCSLRSAATVRLPSSATATKKRRCRSSIASPMPQRYATSLQSIEGPCHQNLAYRIGRHKNGSTYPVDSACVRRPRRIVVDLVARRTAPALGRSDEEVSEPRGCWLSREGGSPHDVVPAESTG